MMIVIISSCVILDISSKSIEKELIKDLVFVFQGIDGNLVKINPKGMFEIVTRVSCLFI